MYGWYGRVFLQLVGQSYVFLAMRWSILAFESWLLPVDKCKSRRLKNTSSHLHIRWVQMTDKELLWRSFINGNAFCFPRIHRIYCNSVAAVRWHCLQTAEMRTVQSPRFWASGYSTKWRIQVITTISSSLTNPSCHFQPFHSQDWSTSNFFPATSPETLHHTVWRTRLFIAYSDKRWLCHQFLTTSLIHLSLKGWENVLFELGNERVERICGLAQWNFKDIRKQICHIVPHANLVSLRYSVRRTWPGINCEPWDVCRAITSHLYPERRSPRQKKDRDSVTERIYRDLQTEASQNSSQGQEIPSRMPSRFRTTKIGHWKNQPLDAEPTSTRTSPSRAPSCSVAFPCASRQIFLSLWGSSATVRWWRKATARTDTKLTRTRPFTPLATTRQRPLSRCTVRWPTKLRFHERRVTISVPITQGPVFQRPINLFLTPHSQAQKGHSPNLLKISVLRNVVRIGSIIISSE